MGNVPTRVTLRDVFLELLAELDLCECDVCHVVAVASTRYNRFGYEDDHALMWAAVGEQLRLVSDGRHLRMSLSERIRRAQTENVAAGRPARGFRPARINEFVTGMGLGIGGRI